MVRKTKAGTFEVDHYWFDAEGKRRRKLKTFPTHREAVAYEKEALAAVQRRDFVPMPKTPYFPTLGAMIELPLKNLFGPCVYVIKETGSVLYVGMSTKGVSRLGDRGHRAIKAVGARENIMVGVFLAHDAKAAMRLETDLILKHKPEFNSVVDLRPIKRW